MIFSWNRERHRTRDRLLEYDFNIYPAAPHTAGLSMLYPWENTALATLEQQILTLARKHGYNGDDETFWVHFADSKVHTGTLDTFPVPGIRYDLYLDTETGELYYFQWATQLLNPELIAQIGAAIVGKSIIGDVEQIYIYLPVKTLLIEDTILDCGSAAEYID